MSVKVNYKVECNIVETLETNIDGLAAGDKSVTHDAFNTQKSLDDSSTPAVTKVADFKFEIAGGDAAIDLQSVTGGGVNGVAVVMDTLKVQVFRVRNPVGNAAVTIDGGTAPYNLMGASWQVILLAGQEMTFYGNEATPDVAIGAKDIQFVGGSGEFVDVLIIAG